MLALLAMVAIGTSLALSNPHVSYGYGYMPYAYGAGYYTPTLHRHNHVYNYVNGYGPGAFTYRFGHY